MKPRKDKNSCKTNYIKFLKSDEYKSIYIIYGLKACEIKHIIYINDKHTAKMHSQKFSSSAILGEGRREAYAFTGLKKRTNGSSANIFTIIILQ